MFYEERRARLQPGALPDYLRLLRETIWPGLATQGAEVLVFLSGLLGAASEETIQLTAYPDFATWQRLQLNSASPRPDWITESAWAPVSAALGSRTELLQEEHVHWLKSCGARVPERQNQQTRRSLYSLRRLSIHPESLREFLRLSEQEIWPRVETQGATILGAWRDAAATEPMMLTVLTGYQDPAHWQAVRVIGSPPDGFTAEQWRQAREAVLQRSRLTMSSVELLMQDHAGAV